MNGSPSRLECEYSGNPQPHVIWYKESNGIHVEMQQSDSISFVNVAHTEVCFDTFDTFRPLFRKLNFS